MRSPQRRSGVGSERAAHGADLERDADFSDELTGTAHAPARQRPVAAVARCVGVCAGLYRAPVVAGGDRDGIDAVHDALVVCRGSVGIRGRDIARRDDSIPHRCTVAAGGGQLFGRVADPGRNDRAIGQVRQDAHGRAAAADRGDARRNRFADSVDQVRTHGVPRLHEQVHGERGGAVLQ